MKIAIVFITFFEIIVGTGLRCVLIHGSGEKPSSGNTVYVIKNKEEYNAKLPNALQR